LQIILQKPATALLEQEVKQAHLHKGWLCIAIATVAGTAIGAFHSTLNAGFLLDDFSHLDYAYNAIHGNWSDLLRVFTGNWTGAADNLTSYRPFISLSFVLDFLIWKTNPFGYHLSNVLMFAGCSVLTSLISLELTSKQAGERSRLFMALAAGMLFALYPLHPEAVSWIIGRVDVQCALFYFSSLYAYLLFRRSGAMWQFITSLLAFGCALPSKEMAVTLPVTILLTEFLLPGTNLGWKDLSLKRRLALTGWYWAMLFTFAIIRTAALGTLVGGYGGGGLKQFIRSLGNFLDRDTWAKVFYGLNEEFPKPTNSKLIRFVFVYLAALLPLRLFERSQFWRVLAFLCLWACVSELPTYQIWHVFPNLCGSRLLFMPSAPLCILLSVIALAPLNLVNQKLETKFLAMLPQIAGAILLVTLACVWGTALQVNQIPWVRAGDQMRTLTSQVRHMAATTPKGKVDLLLDLPQDLSGSGLLGRPEFLERLLRPPLYSSRVNENVLSAESAFPGHHETTYPGLIERLVSHGSINSVSKWSKEEGRYLQWRMPQGANSFEQSLSNQLQTTSAAPIIWLETRELNPFAVQMIELEVSDDKSATDLASKVQLVWRSQNQEKSWIDYSSGSFGMPFTNKIVFMPARFRSWLYQGSIKQIGLKFEPGLKFSIRRITGDDDSALMPRLTTNMSVANEGLDNSSPASHLVVAKLPSKSPLAFNYDCSSIPGAHKTVVVATKASSPLPDLVCTTMPEKSQLVTSVTLNSIRGSLEPPKELLQEKGLHQVAVMACDDEGKPIGFMSEPITVQVR
jgi:hypothetical protein